MITQRLVLNVDHESITPSLSMVQNDSGRQIEFSISDYVIESGTTAAVFFEKPSSTGDLIYISADVDDQTITVTVSPSVLSEKGTIKGQLVLYYGSEVLKSFIFDIDVEADLSRSATASSEDRELITQVVAELTDEMNTRFRELSAMGTFDDGLWIGGIVESLDDIDGDGVTGDSTHRLVLDPDKGIRFINDIGETTAIYPATMAPALRYRGYTYYSSPDSYHKSYTNANDITEMGIWTINNDPISSPMTNIPTDISVRWGYLIVFNSSPDRDDLIHQFIVRANRASGENYIYAREKSGTPASWTSWKNLLETPVGTLVTDSPNAVTSVSDAWTNIGSLTLETGLWHVEATARFNKSADGYRVALLSDVSAPAEGSSTASAVLFADYGVGNNLTYTSLHFSGIVRVADSSKNLYFNTYQNCGSNLSVLGRIQAVRLE